MTPGRELDALVAEKVMGMVACDGWEPVNFGSAGGPALMKQCAHADGACYPIREIGSMGGTVGGCRRYSTEMASAWEVVEWMARGKWQLQLTAVSTDDDNHWWEAEFFAREHLRKGCGDAKTGPHAICLAALQAVVNPQPPETL